MISPCSSFFCLSFALLWTSVAAQQRYLAAQSTAQNTGADHPAS